MNLMQNGELPSNKLNGFLLHRRPAASPTIPLTGIGLTQALNRAVPALLCPLPDPLGFTAYRVQKGTRMPTSCLQVAQVICI